MSKHKKYVEPKRPRTTLHAVFYTTFFFLTIYSGALSYAMFNDIGLSKTPLSYDAEIEKAKHIIATDKYPIHMARNR